MLYLIPTKLNAPRYFDSKKKEMLWNNDFLSNRLNPMLIQNFDGFHKFPMNQNFVKFRFIVNLLFIMQWVLDLILNF